MDTLKVYTGLQLLELSETFYYISTGSKELDRILGGGIRSSAITNIYGLSGSGKTQMCFQLLVNALVASNDCQVVYVTSEKNFYRERLKELLERHSDTVSVEDILKRILFKHYYESEELIYTVHSLHHLLMQQDNHNKIQVIVIDSFSHHIRNLKGWDKVKLSYELLGVLSEIAIDYNCVVIVTTDMTVCLNDLDAETNEPKFSLRPALGDSFLHRVNQNIKLERNMANNVIQVGVKKSLVGKLGSTKIAIREKLGVVDIIKKKRRKRKYPYDEEEPHCSKRPAREEPLNITFLENNPLDVTFIENSDD